MATPALYWTEQQVDTGWRILRADDGSGWRAEEIAGPRALKDENLTGLLRKLQADDEALLKRFTASEIRAAAETLGVDPEPLVAALRG